RRQDVVVDQHLLPRDDRVCVDLERIEAVLERVLRRYRPPRKLSGLPGGDETAAEPAGERAARDVAAGLGTENEIRLPRGRPLGDLVDCLPQRLWIGEQR